MAGCLLRSSSKNVSRTVRSIDVQQRASFGNIVSQRKPCIKVSEEVREAISAKKPVVALETTIYTHGFPHPENAALALHLESVVRLNGGIPATVGVLNGIARVGFSAEELIELTASAGRPETRKVSRRDLPYILGLGYAGRGLNGGTTIAGTMVLARLAGIDVLATGGLGGVHRGGEKSMDISADLIELGRNRMTVIAGGCKSFLDIPRTLEYLETQGVTVGTFADGREGQVDFPAFWTRDSGSPSPLTIKDEEEAAQIIKAQIALPFYSGLFFASPIPAEHSIAKDKMDATIAQAVHDAEGSGSTGSDNTPFILSRIHEITDGASVAANRVLVASNVARGTKVAVHLAKINKDYFGKIRSASTGKTPSLAESNTSWTGFDRTVAYPPSTSRSSLTQIPSRPKDPTNIVVAGALAVDLSCNFIPAKDVAESSHPRFHTSNPASIRQSLGGVGQNVATALHYLKSSVRLCTSVADDIAGSTALRMLAQRGLQISGIQKLATGASTAQYVAINNAQKDLVLAMADMNILEGTTQDFEVLWKPHLACCKPKWLVVDANWDPLTLRKWIDAAKALEAKIAYEPVSTAKSRRVFSHPHSSMAAVPHHSINLATPNALELASMNEAANDTGMFDRDDWWRAIDSIGLSNAGSRAKLVSLTNSDLVDQGIPQQSLRLLPFIPCISTTLGEHGVLLAQMLKPGDGRLTSPTSAPYILSRSTNGSDTVGGVYMRLFPPVERLSSHEIVSVNGVGDTFLGTLIAGLTKDKPKVIADLVDIAQRASVMTLKSTEAVSPQISTLRSLM